MSKYPRGSEWRIWDLHVHTPESIEHNYSGADPWDRFLSELSTLPPDFKVLGINDYWFLDGYRIVRAAFDRGDLPNLAAVFPVLEVRCDTFGGVDGQLSRLNLHLICDPGLAIETLEAQLHPLMQATYRLTPDAAPSTWSQFPSKQSLLELGNQLIAAAPEELRKTYASPLRVGFNNLNVSFETIRKGIESNSALNNRVALALGKVEWADIKWSQQAAAQKKHLINSVDAVFTAAPSPTAFDKSLASLKDAGVLSRLVDCSDAHTWSDSHEPARLGACISWVNADPTFKGLLQALQEYDARFSVDERPAVLSRLARSPRSVVAEVSLRGQGSLSSTVPLFDTKLQLNPGFAVVIGNKGQGKSALLDSMALAANSDRQADYSFLSPERFRSGAGRTAAEYEVEITWADGSTQLANLNDTFDASSPIMVDYLPQSLIEKVCSADPDSTEKRQFEAEIERVLFRHIDANERGSAASLSQLLLVQGAEEQSALEIARADIARVAHELVELNERRLELEAMGLAERLHGLNDRAAAIDKELSELAVEIQTSGSEQQQTAAKALAAAVEERDSIDDKMRAKRASQAEVHSELERVVEQTALLTASLAQARGIADELAATIGVEPEQVLQLSYSEDAIIAWRSERNEQITVLSADLESAGGLSEQSRVASRKVAALEGELEASGDEVQRRLQHQADLAARRRQIDGDPADPQSIQGVSVLAAELERIPERIDALERLLDDGFRAVHRGLVALMDLQKAAYAPATAFIRSNELAESVGLAFDVEFRIREFVDSWIHMVNRQKLGDFYDVERRDRDRQILAGVNLEDSELVLERLRGLVRRLETDRGSDSGPHRSLSSVMRSSHNAGDMIAAVFDLRWLESQYIIRSDGLELSELSPGQRGLVLLLFYLLVDTSERPLLLDQPEENLDNQTVRTSLVPALRQATSRRQVIAVTHNPNLAVVGDADQIIVATKRGAFEYQPGSLAEPPVGLDGYRRPRRHPRSLYESRDQVRPSSRTLTLLAVRDRRGRRGFGCGTPLVRLGHDSAGSLSGRYGLPGSAQIGSHTVGRPGPARPARPARDGAVWEVSGRLHLEYLGGAHSLLNFGGRKH